jgi:hypothetical protein
MYLYFGGLKRGGGRRTIRVDVVEQIKCEKGAKIKGGREAGSTGYLSSRSSIDTSTLLPLNSREEEEEERKEKGGVKNRKFE